MSVRGGVLLALLGLGASVASAQHHHPIATKSPAAQAAFDEGMTLLFAFNHEAAVTAFERAAKLDPGSPMPPWGTALALGPNINLDVDPKRERQAYEAVQRARKLAARAPPGERAYVEALAARYSIDPAADLRQLAVTYSARMRALMERYPDDLDATTLFAESAMDLRPWKLWNLAGAPAEGTEEIVRVLESVLRRDPDHVGANHYYIHAVEASSHPERALPSARRLEGLVPTAGHLLHMPAHVYMRTGDYAGAVRANEAGAEADRALIRERGAAGIYPLMYYNHNLEFLAAAAALDGRYQVAKEAAVELAHNASEVARDMPMIEYAVAVPWLINVRFARWREVLATPEPAAELPLARTLLHYARGVALAATGKHRQAVEEQRAFEAARATVPESTTYGGTGLNSAASVLAVAAAALEARLAAAAGARAQAIAAWERAVEAQDRLAYDEPPPWYYPVRESLGAALLASKQPEAAALVFRADLEQHPRNPRSLVGLRAALRAQGRTEDVAWIAAQLQAASARADAPLRLEDF